MFLKKKEKDPNWTAKQEWELESNIAQHRPGIGKWKTAGTHPNYIGGMYVQDPSRQANLVPPSVLDKAIEKANIEHERKRALAIQASHKKGLGGLFKGLGDKLFGDW